MSDKNLKDMVDAVLGDSKVDFEKSFSKAVNDRIADKMAHVHHTIAKDIIKTNHTSEKQESFVSFLTFDDVEKSLILDDKNSIILNRDEANSLLILFENLNDDNKDDMIDNFFASKESSQDILELAKEIK